MRSGGFDRSGESWFGFGYGLRAAIRRPQAATEIHMIVLLVQVHVKPDAVAAFEAATKDNATNSRLEAGVARFDVVRLQDDATRFVLIEVYRDAQAVAAHKTTAHYLRWRDAVAGLMAEPRVGVAYSSVSPGDEEW